MTAPADPPPPPDRRRENPDAGALWGWGAGCLIGPSLYFVGQVVRTGGLFPAMGGTLCTLFLVSLVGMIGLPLGLAGGRLAVAVRDRSAPGVSAPLAAGVGAYLAAAAAWVTAFAVWAISSLG